MSDFYTGQIQTFGFSFAPRNWSFCAGQVVSISQQATLFSLLGSLYGGNGQTSFGYPNLTSRMPVGFNMGGGTGLTPYNIGYKFGFEHITLTEANLPAHSHDATFTPSGGGATSVVLMATTEDGESATPSNGSYLATTVPGPAGPDQPEKIYRNTTPTNTVTLGGVTATGGGTDGVVNLGNSGLSSSVENRMPFLAVNFSMCVEGIYPPRN